MIWLNRLLAIVLLLLGLGLVWLGGQLLLAGGSPYYLACGLALIAIAWLLWRQSPKALVTYGALWAVSLAWATKPTLAPALAFLGTLPLGKVWSREELD